MLVLFPMVGTVSFLEYQSHRGHSEKNIENLEENEWTTVESIENIRTVAGLGLEDRFFSIFVKQLKKLFK